MIIRICFNVKRLLIIRYGFELSRLARSAATTQKLLLGFIDLLAFLVVVGDETVQQAHAPA